MVFNGKNMDLMQLCFVNKTYVSWWIKARFHSFQLSWDEFIVDIIIVEKLFNTSPRATKLVSWSPSPSGWFKFNVNGSIKVDGSEDGIGGVLKDEYKGTLLTFSLKIGYDPSIMVDILAIKFGWCSFSSSPWAGHFKLALVKDRFCLRYIPRHST
ncbi:hypothetical protein V6N11_071341 [Hibiscus sabdariffa]|uniref:Uncharacterized protein n=1 Tax=Hibiscus sabdariffa TaxID=183260 RepID=A0ABR2U006_9ROSI